MRLAAWPTHSSTVEKFALVGAAVAAYANSFRGAFQFDDFGNIRDDLRLANATTFLRNLPRMIRPLPRLTFFIDRQLYGDSPVGYHVLNLLLHIACGVLVYRILQESVTYLERTSTSEGPHSFRSMPFWMAILFLVHPVQTETVTYLSGRATGLMAFFYLSSFYLFVRAAQSKAQSRVFLLRYLGALACFALALLSKETAITLPVALLLWEYVFRRPTEESFGLPGRFHLPFWGIVAVFLVLAGSQARYRYLFYISLGLRPFWTNIVTQIHAVAYALGLFFLPGSLNFDHDIPVFSSIWHISALISLSLLLCLLLVVIIRIRMLPLFSFGILWFFLLILPTNSVIPRYDLLSERNLYLPSVGIFLAVVSLWQQFCSRIAGAEQGVHILPSGMTRAARALTLCVSAVVMLLLVILTVQRNRIYVNELAFWSDAARKSPSKARPHNNLGNAYFLEGDLDHAIAEFRAASQHDPAFKTAAENLAKALSAKQAQSMPGAK